MAADTAAKRLSAMTMGSPWRGHSIYPTGTVGSGARAAGVNLYSGIAGVVVTVAQLVRATETELITGYVYATEVEQ